MKTLGMIGGTTWVSTKEYYKIINQAVNRRMGENHSAKLILYSFNFQEVLQNKRSGNEKAQSELMTGAAMTLKKAGAEGILLCANTIHKYAGAVSQATGLPVIHIAEITASAILSEGINRVALLGTLPTMQDRFYKDILNDRGIDVLIPESDDRQWLDEIIFTELAREEFRDETRDRILSIIDSLESSGAQGVILGCTELPLIVKRSDTKLPLFDTLVLHAEAAASFIVQSS